MTAPAHLELGETRDPRQLVPGDPEALDAHASLLRRISDEAGHAHDATDSAELYRWSGVAKESWDRNRQVRLGETKRCHDDASQAAKAISHYADVLRTAQEQAREAIALQDQADSQSAVARAAYERTVARQPSSYGSDVLYQLAPRPAFVDPGIETHNAAADLLARARHAVDRAGREAVHQLGGLKGGNASHDNSWWNHDEHLEGPAFQLPFLSAGKKRTLAGKDSREPAWMLRLVDGSASAWALNLGGKAEDYWGPLHVDAAGRLLAGTAGSIVATVDSRGGHVGGDAFVGLRASGDAGGSLAGIGAHATGAAQVGLGASADGHVTVDHGHVRIGVSAGAAVLVGVKLGGEVDVDPGEVTATIEDAGDAIGAWFSGRRAW